MVAIVPKPPYNNIHYFNKRMGHVNFGAHYLNVKKTKQKEL
jgi:hypothetical protein